MKSSGVLTLLTIAGAVLAVSCSEKPKPAVAPEVTSAAAGTTPAPVSVPAPVTAPPIVATPTVGVDEMNRRGTVQDAYFDFDRYEIRADQRDALTKDAAWLKAHPAVKVVVEGHCDERGTAQYNMALGERRAEAVRDYLTGLGIDPARIRIVSYGKERPFATGHDEAAWSQNRRDHFVVTVS